MIVICFSFIFSVGCVWLYLPVLFFMELHTSTIIKLVCTHTHRTPEELMELVAEAEKLGMVLGPLESR